MCTIKYSTVGILSEEGMSEITGAEPAIIIFHHFDKHAAARRILE